jgi:uncharacterized protein
MNRLSTEKSAYLQHASHQKIDWFPWGEEAFDKARREGKPLFLSSGAIWCHWCHVMAKESFEDDQVATILNELYVAVKLDRDERPDIDRRYQRAVAAMGQGGGWPLSVFLTPDKKPFYGGTYFPPDEVYGRPAFKAILMAIAQAYSEKREEIEANSTQILEFIAQEYAPAGAISETLLDEATGLMLKGADTLQGGFGSSPKFPMCGALEFLLGRYALTGQTDLGEHLRKTLTAMAKGGFHDQLAGGFHRYSTDPWWGVPHFEKMADDNAWLLRNYVAAARVFGDSFFEEVARGIIRFIMTELTDPSGGFYASQDADVTPDDEGGYFTWTDEELKEVLGGDELEATLLALVDKKLVVPHNPGKMVLSRAKDVEDVATQLGKNPEETKGLLISIKEKLLAARQLRQKPFVDRAKYTSLNGMLISAFLSAYRSLGNNEIKECALTSLDRMLTRNVIDGTLYHTEGVPAFLDDYANIIDALVAAYEVTGKADYVDKARQFMDRCLEKFWDPKDAGLFDTEESVIGMRLKGIEDTPHPSGNALTAIVLLKLGFILNNPRYTTRAEEVLKAFAPQGQAMGVHSGFYFAALDAFFNMAELTVFTVPASPLAEAALSVFYPYTVIAYGDDNGSVAPCIGHTCFEPVRDSASLSKVLAGALKASPA